MCKTLRWYHVGCGHLQVESTDYCSAATYTDDLHFQGVSGAQRLACTNLTTETEEAPYPLYCVPCQKKRQAEEEFFREFETRDQTPFH